MNLTTISTPSILTGAGAELTTDVVMSVLLRLPSSVFSNLLHSLSLDLHIRRRRLLFLLFSPLHFSSTILYLRSMSLSQKTLLLARLLLSSLHHLLPLTHSPLHRLRLRDLDAALLLMAMCESYDNSAKNLTANWHTLVITDLLLRNSTPFAIGDSAWVTICHYVDLAAKCRSFIDVVQGGDQVKFVGEVGVSVSAVVSLPSVECSCKGVECVICKDEIDVGRDVCELPCNHLFHWSCVLVWLRKRNTCPVCRFELPTDNVLCEMKRMWRAVESSRCESDEQQRRSS